MRVRDKGTGQLFTVVAITNNGVVYHLENEYGVISRKFKDEVVEEVTGVGTDELES